MNNSAKILWNKPLPPHGHEDVLMLLREVGEFQRLHWNSVSAESISDKGVNQLVSFVDQSSELQLMEGLQRILPESVFIGEEHNANAILGDEPTWIIDPLDGTTNYLHGLPIFSISVALWYQGALELGYVYCPVLNEMYFGIRGQGAFKNGSNIQVSAVSESKNSLLATGFPYYEFSKTPQYLSLLNELMRGTHGLRRMGSAAIDLVYTAEGRFDGFYELGLAPWDVAAGALILLEAGGVVSDFESGDDYLFGQEIIAANPSIHRYLKDRISHHFSKN